MLRSLYFRMSVIHYVGIVLLILNAFLLTENLYSQIVQIVIAVVIFIHEADERINGRGVAKNIIRKFEAIKDGKDIEFNTKFASEFDVLHKMFDEVSKIQIEKKRDEEFINIAKDILLGIKNGAYDKEINANSKNKLLEDFKVSVNDLIRTTKNYFEELNKILKEYSSNNYTNTIEIKNYEGIFKDTIENINLLRDNIVYTLNKNLSIGNELQNNADVLLKNIVNLDKSSKDSVESLNTASSAINDMTKDISLNTNNIVKVTNFSLEIINLSRDGQELSSNTTNAMDDIKERVDSINESISVIDQIAFQTNILSLNAAVEAATAGEAGKGFAVVAGEVRNLANRSAEAANEIKAIVEDATIKANEGKEISYKMIEGYNLLSKKIQDIGNLLKEIEELSKEQEKDIKEINETISQIDSQIKDNSKIASVSDSIAKKVDIIAKEMIEFVKDKKF